MGFTKAASAMSTAIHSRFARELILVLLCYIPYEIAHGLAGSKPEVAFENARRLVALEGNLGLLQESALQQAILSSRLLVHVSNVVYFYGHWPVIIVSAICLLVWRPRIYVVIRNAFLLSGAIALTFYILFPVAPPRLSDPAILDTLAFPVPVGLEKSRMVNPYGAFPSMHVGWDVLIGMGLFWATRKPMVRLFAVLLPIAMSLAIITTGNHFFIDGIAGGAIALGAMAMVLWRHNRVSKTSTPNSSRRRYSPGGQASSARSAGGTVPVASHPRARQ